MTSQKSLRVAALIDLPRSNISGGHVKGWERLAKANSNCDLPLDLTVYFSGETISEDISDKSHIKQLPPVFSTSKLKFLPYVPDHTDLASYHKKLAKELKNYDIIHTTDGFFAFAKTAEKISKKYNIPLVTSFHTDTPAYARIFTKMTIEKQFGNNWFSNLLLKKLNLPKKQEEKKINRLKKHLSACHGALYTRKEDGDLAKNFIDEGNTKVIRLGVDREMFGIHRKNRKEIKEKYNIPDEHLIVVFVGRLDVGKNIYVLIEALENLISEGKKIHLVTAGVGPAEQDLKDRLGNNVTVAGFIDPNDLAILYASADVLALTSEVETRSQACIEAMTSGLPTLVAEKCAVTKLFNNTPAIDIVPTGVDGWTKAIRDMEESKNKRTHMHKTALAYSNNYISSWEDVLKEDLFYIWKKVSKINE